MYSLSSFFFSAAAVRKCRRGVLLRAVSKHPAGSSRPALCKCRPAAQIAIPYVILPLKISPAGLQRKMHPPFGYSLPKPKGRCECANFQIAHWYCFSIWGQSSSSPSNKELRHSSSSRRYWLSSQLQTYSPRSILKPSFSMY